jgi:hypothetical protein
VNTVLLLVIEVGQLRTQPTFVLGPLTLDAQVLHWRRTLSSRRP